MLLTVFTPTYNRAHTLTRLYESLTRQSDRDFEWLVVDDGSTDNTRELVEGWMKEGKITVRYGYKENGGKPSAHNAGAKAARGDFFFCVDSDDYLADNAVALIRIKSAELTDKHVGLIYFRTSPNGTCITHIDNHLVKDFTLKEGYDRYGLAGDTALVFKTDILRRFEFPKFEGEKFVPEGYLYDKIDTLGKFLLVRESIYICEYQSDGYTANMKRVLYKNPKGYFAYIENRLKIDKEIEEKFLDSVRYMAMAIAHKKPEKIRGAVYPLIALVAYLPGWVLYLRDFKRYRNEV